MKRENNANKTDFDRKREEVIKALEKVDSLYRLDLILKLINNITRPV